MADVNVTDNTVSGTESSGKQNIDESKKLLKDTPGENQTLEKDEKEIGISNNKMEVDKEGPESEETEKDATDEKDVVSKEDDAEMKDENVNKNEETTDPYEYTKGDQFTSEIFKIELRNLPRFGFGQMKKLLSSLKLDPVKIKSFGLKDSAFITFRCEEDRKKALSTLNGYKWRNRKIKAVKAKPMRDPLVMKRKQETEEQGENKKLKSAENDDGLTPDIRLKKALEPSWNVPYEEQLQEKMSSMSQFLTFLSEELKKTAGTTDWLDQNMKDYNNQTCELLPILPSPVLVGYRNKCELSIGKDLEGNDSTVGFKFGSYKEGTNAIGDPSHLSIIPESIKTVAKEFEKWIRLSRFIAFDPETKKGHWSQLTVRICREGDIMAIADFHTQNLKSSEVNAEMQRIRDYFSAGVTSFWFRQIADRQSDKSREHGMNHLFGSKTLTEDLLGMKFDISPDAFFQVNTAAAEVLYRVIADWCEVTPNTTLLDICCGTGTIGLSMAKDVYEVIGVEKCQQAVTDAKKNARMNGINNAVFIAGSAENVIPRVPKMMRTNECVAVVDPPRSGLHPKVMRVIRKTEQIKKLIYVSCSPKAAISNMIDLVRRRSKQVKGAPFKLVRACPVDLFPMTAHVELIIEFRRMESSNHKDDSSCNENEESDEECEDEEEGDDISEKDKDGRKDDLNNDKNKKESGDHKSKSSKKSKSNSSDWKKRKDRKSSNQSRDRRSRHPSDYEHDRFFHLAGYDDPLYDIPPGFPEESDIFPFGGPPGRRFRDFGPDFDVPPMYRGSPDFDGPPMYGGSPGYYGPPGFDGPPGFGGRSRFGEPNEFFERGFDRPPRFGFSEDMYDRDNFMGPPSFGFSEDYERFDDFEPDFRRPFGPRGNMQRGRGFRDQFGQRDEEFDRGIPLDSMRGRGSRMRGFGHMESFAKRDQEFLGHGPEDAFGRGQNVFGDRSVNDSFRGRGRGRGALLSTPDTSKNKGGNFRGSLLGNPRGRGFSKSDSFKGIGHFSDQKGTNAHDGQKSDDSQKRDMDQQKSIPVGDNTNDKSKSFDTSSKPQPSFGKTGNWGGTGASGGPSAGNEPRSQYGFGDSNRSQSGQTGNWGTGTGQSYAQKGTHFSGGGSGQSYGQNRNQSGGGGTAQSYSQGGNQYGDGGTGQSYGQMGNQYGDGSGQSYGQGGSATGQSYGQVGNQYGGAAGQSYGQGGNQYSGGAGQSYGQGGGGTGQSYNQGGGGTGQTYGQVGNQYGGGTGQSYGQGSNQYGGGTGQGGNQYGGGTAQSYGQGGGTGQSYGQGGGAGTGQSYGQGGGSGGTGQSYGQSGGGGGTGQSYGQGGGVGGTGQSYGQGGGGTGQSYGQGSGGTGQSYGQGGDGTGQSYAQTSNQYGGTGQSYGQGSGAPGQSYGQTGNQYGGTGQSYGQSGNQYGNDTNTQYNWSANQFGGNNAWQTYNQADQNANQGNWNTSDQSSYNQTTNQSNWNMSNQNAYGQTGNQYAGTGTGNTGYNQYGTGTPATPSTNQLGSGTTNNQYTGGDTVVQPGYTTGSDQTGTQTNWSGAGGQPYYQTNTSGQWGNQYATTSAYSGNYDPSVTQYTAAESYSTSSGIEQKTS